MIYLGMMMYRGQLSLKGDCIDLGDAEFSDL